MLLFPDPKESFRSFLERVATAKNNRRTDDTHWWSSFDITRPEPIRYSTIIEFENVVADAGDVLNAIDIDDAVPRPHFETRAKREARGLYGPQEKRFVRDASVADFSFRILNDLRGRF
jgi:hypothetical protein